MQRIFIELNTKTGITYVSLENIAYVEVGGPQPVCMADQLGELWLLGREEIRRLRASWGF